VITAPSPNSTRQNAVVVWSRNLNSNWWTLSGDRGTADRNALLPQRWPHRDSTLPNHGGRRSTIDVHQQHRRSLDTRLAPASSNPRLPLALSRPLLNVKGHETGADGSVPREVRSQGTSPLDNYCLCYRPVLFRIALCSPLLGPAGRDSIIDTQRVALQHSPLDMQLAHPARPAFS
jgi:hypothetical protein